MNISNMTPDDPRLTAYALGELTDADDIKAIEAAIAADPQLAAAVKDIRSTADILGCAFNEEKANTPAGKDLPTVPSSEGAQSTSKKNIRFPGWLGLAAAAAVAATIGVMTVINEEPNIREVGQMPERDLEVVSADTLTQTRVLEPSQHYIEVPQDLRNPPYRNEPRKWEGITHNGVHYTAKEFDFKDLKAENEDAEGPLSVKPLRGAGDAASAGESAVVALRVGDELMAMPSTKPAADGSNYDSYAYASEGDKPQTISASDFFLKNSQPAEARIPVAGSLDGASVLERKQVLFANARNGLNQGPIAGGRIEIAEPELTPAAPSPDYRQQRERSNTEGYLPIVDNAFQSPKAEPLSTFSIDVDTASYANVRRYIESGQLPPPNAVRIEEMVNYFPYDYPAPANDAKHPLAIYLDAAPAAWNPDHRVVRVAMKAKEVNWDDRPPSNLVFLIDVSGSMSRPNKLPLVKDALAKLVRRLDARDRVAIVVYAGASGLVLPSTTANNTETIQHALDNLQAGGSTNGGQGLALAYKVAREHLLKDGNNRILLCSDGDFNVGTTDKGEIADMAAENAKDGIYLTVLGFGMGNLKDDMLENLSNRGNGNYAYIDSEKEARKVFVEQATGTLLTVAKDVKIQVEFNPAFVQAYRLIGYENRMLAAQDFNDDKKDAGEVGAGHTVTALYEVVPVSSTVKPKTDVDPLKYAVTTSAQDMASIDNLNEMKAKMDKEKPKSEEPQKTEWLTVKMRYKLPESDTSTKLEYPLKADKISADFAKAKPGFRFASAVAEFGLILRDSPYKGDSTLAQVRTIAEDSLGKDPGGYRSDFVELVEKTEALKAQ